MRPTLEERMTFKITISIQTEQTEMILVPILMPHIGENVTTPVSSFSESCTFISSQWTRITTTEGSQLYISQDESTCREKRRQQVCFHHHNIPLTVLQGLCYSDTFHINLWSINRHSTPAFLSSVTVTSVDFFFIFYFEFCFRSTYNFLLYKVFKILFVLYDVSMVMFFIKEEENLFLLLVCFIILF